MPRRERVEMHTFDLYHSPRAWGMSIIRTACPTQWHERATCSLQALRAS